jgi:hypothetical protein
MTDNPTLLRLAAYRLERTLTFKQLSAQMAEAGYPVRTRSLHNALTPDALQGGPRETTLYNITQFVASVVHAWEQQRRRRKPARRSAA